jgi:uncharacterized protein involved in outer membrane biogenesis
MDRSHRGLWFALFAAASALALVVLLISWALHPASLKPRIIAEVERATGRTMTISGDIGVKLSLEPTISIDDVTLSNPAGTSAGAFSRPEMLRVARVELSLALLPLLEHRLEVSHISLIRPDIMLETGKSGRRNWAFARDLGPVAGQAARRDANEPPPVSGGGFAMSFTDILVDDGRVGWIDGATGRRVSVDVPRLTLTAPVGGGGVEATGTILWDRHKFALTGRTGAIEREPGAWPVALRLESDGATLTAEGRLMHPGDGRGFDFKVDARIPEPSVFSASFPSMPLGMPLTALKDVKLHAEVNDGASSAPIVSAATMEAGAIDLDALAKGVRLTNVSLSARGDQPIQITAGIASSGFDAGVRGTIGAPGLLNGVLGSVAVDLDWNAASARGNVRGTIGSLVPFSAYSLDVAADVPRPSLLSERAPSTLKSFILRAHLTDGPAPSIFQMTSSAGDLSGAVTVTREPRLSVTGEISSRRLDLDALRLSPAAEPPAAGTGGSTSASGQAPSPPLIGDTRLPFERLRAADANVKVRLADVRFAGTDLSGVEASLSAKDGLLLLDAAARSDQPMSMQLVVDATKAPPAMHLTMRAPGFPLRLMLAALDLPQVATGTAEVQADLTGTGDTPKQIAGSLIGAAGFAVESGQLDSRMVNAWLAELKPLHIGGGDMTDLRCLAVRADATAGVVAVQPLALNTAALILEGSGDVDLGHETLALRLRPRTKIGGTGIALPLRVSGPLRSPSARVDIAAGGGGGGALAGLLLGGKDIMGAGGGGDPCPGALARAREAVAAEGKP